MGVLSMDDARALNAPLIAQRPLDERRDALDRLIEEITPSEGGAQGAFRVKDPSLGFRYQEPYSPPLGGGERKVGWCAVGGRRTAGW